MPNLVWLASYPKSGNTWMRAFLTAYLSGPDSALDLNDLDASLHAANRSLFDRVIGFPSSDLAPYQIEDLRPDVYRAFDREAEDALFLKTHDRFRLAPSGEPVFPADATRMAVLIVRNPLAIAASTANHYSITVDEAIDQMADDSRVLAKQESTATHQLPQPLGSWSSHTSSWLDQSELAVIVVRYEDLRRDPAAEFSRVLAACGIEPRPTDIADAMTRTSFERLQRAEAEHGFSERPLGTPAFFRAGETDAWRAELSAHQVARLLADHGPMMTRLGYGAGMTESNEQWSTPRVTELNVTMDTAILKTGSGGDGSGKTAPSV